MCVYNLHAGLLRVSLSIPARLHVHEYLGTFLARYLWLLRSMVVGTDSGDTGTCFGLAGPRL